MLVPSEITSSKLSGAASWCATVSDTSIAIAFFTIRATSNVTRQSPAPISRKVSSGRTDGRSQRICRSTISRFWSGVCFCVSSWWWGMRRNSSS